MKFSLWTQKWKHSEDIDGNREKIMANLMNYYQNSSKSFRLLHNDSKKFTFSRGWKTVSLLIPGSERWCFHIIEVTTSDKNNSVMINWDIDLKFFGFQLGKNAIVEECKQLTKSNDIIA